MQKPKPESGLVIRYDYLWRNEARRGQQDGSKDRPCAIVIALESKGGSDYRALVAAITHSEPASGDGMEIPTKVKRHLGLDTERSWVILSELNEIDWSDPGIIPASKTQWAYGFLPAAFAQDLRDRVRERIRAAKLPVTRRK